MSVRIITDLPPGTPERYDPCPRCGEKPDWVDHDKLAPTTEMFSRTQVILPHDRATFRPCGDTFDLNGPELDGYTVHAAIQVT